MPTSSRVESRLANLLIERSDELPHGYKGSCEDGTAVLDEICRLRVDAWIGQANVLTNPAAWLDEHDHLGDHILVRFGGRAVAAVRVTIHRTVSELPNAEVYLPVLPGHFPTPVASYNRMVVAPEHRGRGISRYLDAVSVAWARHLGAKALVGATGSIEASRHRIETMERLGFVNLGQGAHYETVLLEAGRPTVLVLRF